MIIKTVLEVEEIIDYIVVIAHVYPLFKPCLRIIHLACGKFSHPQRGGHSKGTSFSVSGEISS